MAIPVNPQVLKKLDDAAAECERADDFLGALDIYEEIERRGWSQARHLTGLGYCYFKNRQRQNAKEIWLRALEMDADFGPAQEALDKLFPGWKKQAQAKPTKSQEDAPVQKAATPPPPPPAAFASAQSGELTVETTSALKSSAGQIKPFSPAPAQEARAAQSMPFRVLKEEAKFAPGAAVARSSAPTHSAPAPTPAQPEQNEARVNWAYIMHDVAEESAYRNAGKK